MGCLKLHNEENNTPMRVVGRNGKRVGKEKDLESGLYYYGARYYAACTCRFISVDPLSAKYAQLSPYNYADNNPVNDFDIDGMQNNNSEGSAQSGSIKNPLPVAKDANGNILTAPETGEPIRPSVNAVEVKAHKNFWDKLRGVIHKINTGIKKAFQKVGEIIQAVGEKIGEGLNSIESSIKGHAYWSFGIEFKTHDGKWNGNKANPVKPKNFDNVLTLFWDEISDVAEVFNAIGKNRKTTPFKEQAENLVTDEQNKGKNWDETENRTGANFPKDTVIMFTNSDSSKMVIGYSVTGGSDSYHSGTLTKKEVKKRFPTLLSK